MSKSAFVLSVVLPAHNEARNIAAIAARLAAVMEPLPGWEIIFVNDGSTDATLAEIKRLAAADRRVRFVSLARNFGHAAAVRAGLSHARGDGVVLMDCDFEHPPELVPKLVEAWSSGAKVVVTRRTTSPGQASFMKRTSSRLFYRFFNAFGDVHIEAGSADFMLLDRQAVEALAPFNHQELFLRGFIRWLGFPLAHVDYTQGARQTGESKFTFRRMVDFAAMGIVTHSLKPLRIGLYLSLMFALIGLLLFLYSLISFVWIGRTVAGWTSIMSAIAILGSGQFLVLGIIGEYVGRLVRQTRGWPLFMVTETESNSAAPPLLTPSCAAGRKGV
jgi:polyisoprenyl-phosphate glycosyltransferase